ncbi:MAG: CPBP family intramembrane metalloprotease [Oscillospiraceae bacterium]|nr:CPBP family intramembrane metalloprotease [Oscillospiraceae bacterium]
MKKLFEKKPVLFAVIWIVIYVVGFGSAGIQTENAALNYALQTAAGLIICGVLLGFIRKNGLAEHFGLCRFRGEPKRFLYLLPPLLAAAVNIWSGFGMREQTAAANLLGVLAIGVLGPFLEELILRSILFRAVARTNTRRGFWIAALSFGIGHLVNIAYGASVPDTLIQVGFACCFGICAGALLYTGKSLLPGVLLHIMHNSLGFIGATEKEQVWYYLPVCVIDLAYGAYLLHTHRETCPLTSAPYPDEEGGTARRD